MLIAGTAIPTPCWSNLNMNPSHRPYIRNSIHQHAHQFKVEHQSPLSPLCPYRTAESLTVGLSTLEQRSETAYLYAYPPSSAILSLLANLTSMGHVNWGDCLSLELHRTYFVRPQAGFCCHHRSHHITPHCLLSWSSVKLRRLDPPLTPSLHKYRGYRQVSNQYAKADNLQALHSAYC